MTHAQPTAAPVVTSTVVRDGFADAAPRTGLRGRLSTLPDAMLLAGAVALPLGLVMVFLGWYGAARTPYLFEQVPYLVSGGLLGLALVLTGGFVLFGSWVARTASEQRAETAQLLATLEAVREELAGLPAAIALATTPVPAPAQRSRRGAAASPATAVPVAASSTNGHRLVATAHGSMIHRPDCVVVANREDVQAVSNPDKRGLQPCRLCDPLAAAAPVRA